MWRKTGVWCSRDGELSPNSATPSRLDQDHRDWRAPSWRAMRRIAPDSDALRSPCCRAARSAFLAHYVRRHPAGHAIVLASVLIAVACGVAHAVRHEAPDRRRRGRTGRGGHAGLVCMRHCSAALVAADNLLWRVAGCAAARTFVAVTGDIRARPVRTSVRPFAELLRRTAARRAGQPHHRHGQRRRSRSRTPARGTCCRRCIAVVCAIALIGTVNLTLAAALVGVRRGAGRADLLPGAARHAAASRLCRPRPPRWMASWST